MFITWMRLLWVEHLSKDSWYENKFILKSVMNWNVHYEYVESIKLVYSNDFWHGSVSRSEHHVFGMVE